MYYAQFGMFNIQQLEDKILKLLHSMTLCISSIDDYIPSLIGLQ